MPYEITVTETSEDPSRPDAIERLRLTVDAIDLQSVFEAAMKKKTGRPIGSPRKKTESETPELL